MIKLEEITADNLEDVLKLKVSKNQENFVSTTAYSLAQAYVYQENAYPFAIYADDILVGFIMFGFYESRNQYTLWKFLIDKCHQNKGYGKTALLLGIERMKEEHNIQKMYTGVSLGNEVAERLYKSVGFQLTGLVENGMKELQYVFAKSEKCCLLYTSAYDNHGHKVREAHHRLVKLQGRSLFYIEEKQGNDNITDGANKQKPEPIHNRIAHNPAQGNRLKNPGKILQSNPGASPHAQFVIVILEGHDNGCPRGNIVEQNLSDQTRNAEQEQFPAGKIFKNTFSFGNY